MILTEGQVEARVEESSGRSLWWNGTRGLVQAGSRTDGKCKQKQED